MIRVRLVGTLSVILLTVVSAGAAQITNASDPVLLGSTVIDFDSEPHASFISNHAATRYLWSCDNCGAATAAIESGHDDDEQLGLGVWLDDHNPGTLPAFDGERFVGTATTAPVFSCTPGEFLVELLRFTTSQLTPAKAGLEPDVGQPRPVALGSSLRGFRTGPPSCFAPGG